MIIASFRSAGGALLEVVTNAPRHLRAVPAVPEATRTYRPAAHEDPDYVEARIAEERAQGVTKAWALLNRPGYNGRTQALYVLHRSVFEQARLAGVSAPELLTGPGACPCGGRCGR